MDTNQVVDISTNSFAACWQYVMTQNQYVNDYITGLAVGAGFFLFVAGFTVVRSYITEKEDI